MTRPLTEEDVRRIVRDEIANAGDLIARTTVRHILHRAARGPSSMAGGSLVTGAAVTPTKSFATPSG